MVDTMARLRAFLPTPRLRGVSRRPAAGALAGAFAGSPAGEEVLLDAPDDRLAPALVAAAHGAHGPAAALLAGTRDRADWDHRDRYVSRLAAFARSRPEWLRSWHAAAPDDPDGRLVAVRLAVDRCWESPDRAGLLREIAPMVADTAERGGDDPVPWRVALDSARGRGAGHAEFERLWAEAVRRCPHHYGCHVAALAYLAAASPGAHRECLDFAETAARDAPEGSPLRELPLRAAFRCLTEGGAGAVEPARLETAADLALALSAAQPAADPWPAELRNLLVYVLVRLERWSDALEQLRLTGPYATSFPWDREADDALGRFLQVREGVRAAVADRTPAAGCGGRGSPAGPGAH
ncbi:hypothetical protein GCM10010240_06540 [Streptomyces griseoviridis]|nr:hypothetical protein [Streptomyces griseoviridis]GGS76065.1 hypothetical protein GCM10010240_06540 [Streptomyces griseoviridis]